MGIIRDFLNAGNGLRVEKNGAARVVVVGRGNAYAASAVSGTIGAALASGSSVFAMRLDAAAPMRAYIERIRLQWTTVVAFTTALTVGRRLALHRGSSGTPTFGGTTVVPVKKHSAGAVDSEFLGAAGGAIAISTTGALTVTGITVEADPIRTMSLAHVGAAGAFFEQIWEFSGGESYPCVLEPGQSLHIRTPVAMDAAGTWSLAVSVDWHEAETL